MSYAIKHRITKLYIVSASHFYKVSLYNYPVKSCENRSVITDVISVCSRSQIVIISFTIFIRSMAETMHVGNRKSVVISLPYTADLVSLYRLRWYNTICCFKINLIILLSKNTLLRLHITNAVFYCVPVLGDVKVHVQVLAMRASVLRAVRQTRA